MKIVVLDGHTLNPGDLDWSPLKNLGACVIHERTRAVDTVARLDGAAVALTNKVVFDRAVLDQLPDLRYIGVIATGTNVVDIPAARERGIVVTNVPAYSTMSVAQLTFGLLLEMTLHVGHHTRSVRTGDWVRSEDFAYWNFPLTELDGLTLGLVGFGAIAQAVARIGQAFGLRVMAHRRSDRPPEVPGVRMVDLDTIFRESDVVSVHCPLTPETRGLINAGRLSTMKRSALLINTSRGPLVNEADLAQALNSGEIAGAGLDVLSVEPPGADNPLLTAANCFVTPHIAWASRAARSRLLATVASNVAAFLEGEAQNVVS